MHGWFLYMLGWFRYCCVNLSCVFTTGPISDFFLNLKILEICNRSLCLSTSKCGINKFQQIYYKNDTKFVLVFDLRKHLLNQSNNVSLVWSDYNKQWWWSCSFVLYTLFIFLNNHFILQMCYKCSTSIFVLFYFFVLLCVFFISKTSWQWIRL